jgi:hypothetical protein
MDKQLATFEGTPDEFKEALDKTSLKKTVPFRKYQQTISIDKDLMSFVREQVRKTKAPSINRWVNDVLRRLWAGSER